MRSWLTKQRKPSTRYLEKVVDTTLAYRTTPKEAIAKAGIGEDPIGKHVSECCASLGVSNIRVIKTIDRVVRLSAPISLSIPKFLE
jgi:hypothetical protein